MTNLQNFVDQELKSLDRGIVATPNTREDLEAFAKANNGSMDLILMQMAMNFGYKIALQNVKEQITNQNNQFAI
jgi:hypothetical protein